MKTITLQHFHDEVKKLAVKKGRTFFAADVKLSEHLYKDGTLKKYVTFQCYVDGFSHYDGTTMNEALGKLRSAMFPSNKPIPNVEVEI